jgi:hypothetical protein
MTKETEIKLRFLAPLWYSVPSECLNFLDFHFSKYIGNSIDFLYFIETFLTTDPLEYTRPDYIPDPDGTTTFIVYRRRLLDSPKKQVLFEWLETKKKEIQQSKISVKQDEKIKWNGTPSQFAYLFLELVKHGFIEPPLYNGEQNFTGLSRLCYQYFDIQTTPGNLIKEMNPEKNTLSDTKRAKFTIPDISDLA